MADCDPHYEGLTFVSEASEADATRREAAALRMRERARERHAEVLRDLALADRLGELGREMEESLERTERLYEHLSHDTASAGWVVELAVTYRLMRKVITVADIVARELPALEADAAAVKRIRELVGG